MGAMTSETVQPSLLGVDVGFSKLGRTTGMAWRIEGKVSAARAGSSWESRASALPPDALFDLTALDAPLVPEREALPRRGCEAAFYSGAFWNRCRPGMSHHGRGLELRNAGRVAATQFRSVMQHAPVIECQAFPEVAFVEAFPNTFLGVLLPAATFSRSVKPRTQPRSDWLYEAVQEEGILERLLDRLGWMEGETRALFLGERNHDLRAALVCLLTAGFANAGTATVVGDEVGGWFWLPPVDLWADWAVHSLDANLTKLRGRDYPDLFRAPPRGERVVSVDIPARLPQ